MEKNINYIKENLKELFPEQEIDAFIHWIFDHIKGYSRIDLVLNKNEHLKNEDTLKVKQIVDRLKNKEPIQYILGETQFCGLSIKLSKDVLIPRPETEEIVEYIRQETAHSELRILDIGTGSGCIPLALKNYFPEAQVSACDISEEALEVAKENGVRNKLLVNFFKHDILSKDHLQGARFDLIVSNPPYVRKSEMKHMEANVLEHEPHLALFVENDDPLIFYRAILAFSRHHLSTGGRLYFEINENLGAQLVDLMEAAGFNNILLKKDLQGKERLLTGRLKR